MSQADSESSPGQHHSDDLKLIASRQRVILVCILIHLIAVFSQFLLPAEMRPILGIGGLVISIFATVFVFLLATKLYGTVTGILLGILTIIPLIGLIVLLVVNGKATNTLKANGVSVGLLGARGPIS